MYFPGNPDPRCKRDRSDVWRITASISGFIAASLLAVGVWVLA